MPYQLHTGEVTFILHNPLQKSHLIKSGKREYPNRCFLPCFERRHAKISTPEVHKFFITTVCGQGCQNQHYVWDREPSLAG